MAILKVDKFRSEMRLGGARANLFNIIFAFPPYVTGGDTDLTALMCRSAAIPGSTLGVVEVPFRGRLVKLPGDRTFEPWEVTIYNDNNFSVRNFFEQWMNGMNTHEGNEGKEALTTGSGTYAQNIEVQQLDQVGTNQISYFLKNAFPSAIGQIELNYDQVTSIEEFTVTFEYDYWTNNVTQ
jgi:hypothetical protein